MNEYQNPLPCGCAVVGRELINPISGYPEYKDLHVKHCEMHANAAAELARLQAIEAAAMAVVKTHGILHRAPTAGWNYYKVRAGELETLTSVLAGLK